MNSSSSESCLNCGGLIMEPGISYGYAGKVCLCPVKPRWQRRLSDVQETKPGDFIAAELRAKLDAQAAELEKLQFYKTNVDVTLAKILSENDQLTAKLAKAKEALEKLCNKIPVMYQDPDYLIEARQALKEIGE